MKKGVENKYGLSPVIASVLMILLVLVLAVMIFLWARGFISEHIEKFGSPIQESCSSIDFKAKIYEGKNLEIINRGNIDIRHLDVKLFDADGNSEINMFDFQVEAGEGVTNYVTLQMADGTEPDKIIIYPALMGKVRGKSLNKVFTCMDVGVTL